MKTAVLAVLAAVPLFVSSCDKLRGLRGKAEATREKVVVKVLSVGKAEAEGTCAYVGRVEASRTIMLTAPASGSLVSLKVHEGQAVSHGQLLAEIESRALNSSLKMARASYDQATDAMERLEKVYGSGSVPEIRMIEMQTNLSKAEAAVEAASAAVEDCRVKAPMAGVVSDVNVVAGSELTLGAPMFRIIDTKSLEIHFPLPEKEVVKVRVGTSAKVYVPAIDRHFDARLTNRAAVPSRLSHSYDCTLVLSRPSDELVPGMVCKVSISAPSDEASVVVPASAVMTGSDGRYVWTVNDGTVFRRNIGVGGYEGNGIVVSEGLEPGDFVVIEGVRKISTGMKVTAVEQKSE